MIRNWGGRAAARTSFALRGLAHIYALRATRAGAYIRALRAPQDLEAQGGKLGRQSRCKDKLRATGAGAYIRASRHEGWRIYTRFARTTGRSRGIRNWGGRAAARTSFALRGLAHIYALRAHHRTWRRRGKNWGGKAAARTSFALRGLAHIYALRAHHGEAQGGLGRQSRCKDKLRATRAGAYIRASRAPQDFEGGAGGIRDWGGRAAARTSFALRGLAHIYALRAHHREAQGDKELRRQSRCMDKLRATGADAYIRASRAPRGGAGGIGAAEPLQGQASRYGADAYIRASRAPQASRYDGWRIYTRFARTTGFL